MKKEPFVAPYAGEKYAYILTRPMTFSVPELKLPPMTIYTLKGELIAAADKGKLSFFPPYVFDGCTGIGRLWETWGTLRAALLHDGLYQLAEQVSFAAPYTRKQADSAFRKHLPCAAKWPYYAGVRLFGRRYWQAERNDLKIITH